MYDLGLFHFRQMQAYTEAEWAWLAEETGLEIDRAAWAGIINAQGDAVTLPGSEPGNLLSVPKGERDDLTALTGINAEAQDMLYDMGVFHYWQIAAWNDDEAANAAARLSLRGAALEGDAWLGDAKARAAA